MVHCASYQSNLELGTHLLTRFNYRFHERNIIHHVIRNFTQYCTEQEMVCLCMTCTGTYISKKVLKGSNKRLCLVDLKLIKHAKRWRHLALYKTHFKNKENGYKYCYK